jgi:hypothetical protein
MVALPVVLRRREADESDLVQIGLATAVFAAIMLISFS